MKKIVAHDFRYDPRTYVLVSTAVPNLAEKSYL